MTVDGPSSIIVGVKYDANRVFVAAQYFKQMLEEEATNESFNSNTIGLHANIFDLKEMLPSVKVLYMYDEAFPPDLMDYVPCLIKKSPSLQWVVSFKHGRHSEYEGFLEAEAGLELVDVLACNKQGSGESSRAHLYECRKQHSSGDHPVLNAAAYFELSLAGKIAYYDHLILSTRLTLATKRKSHKPDACCGPESWTACSHECRTFESFFQHMPRNKLEYHEVDWLDAQLGIFTRNAIQPNTMIIKYMGKSLVSIAEVGDPRFVLRVGTRFIDAKGRGLQQYVNHHCAPNCALQKWKDRYGQEVVSIVSREPIAANAELFVNYGRCQEPMFGLDLGMRCKCSACEDGSTNQGSKRKRFLGMTLQWEYSGRTVNMSVPGYIEKALLEFLHEPNKPTKAPLHQQN